MDTKIDHKITELNHRKAALEIQGDDFRRLGHQLVDEIADFMDGLSKRPVTMGESPQALRKLLGDDRLPAGGTSPEALLEQTANLLFDHSLFNGHPRFWGYITSSAAPIGALADLLAASVNPNVGAWDLSPIASEIEGQTVRWIADLIGYPRSCGGLLVSGGNMANFVCFLAARKAKANWDIHKDGQAGGGQRMVVYVSKETHTWIDKAAELFGLGADSVRWIDTNADLQMDVTALEKQILSDLDHHFSPLLVVGTAGTVGTGVVDPLPEIAEICKKYDLWFHVDGAYGAPAAALPEADDDLKALREADSIALDPHKWLYTPLEAGCSLVRDPQSLVEAFSHHPAYYNFDGSQEDPQINYHEFGLQNSRGFRALKVWLGLRQVGREGYIDMIRDDIALAQAMFEEIGSTPELQPFTRNLSITTFRFVPADLPQGSPEVEAYLNELNEEVLNHLQKGGQVFVSNAMIEGRYLLRASIVNFRTTLADVKALPEIVLKIGRELDAEMRPDSLQGLEVRD
jgi:aromatic-L-amino-acid decarboxylase